VPAPEIITGLDAACEHLRRRVAASPAPTLIAIAGRVASGKSTLARAMGGTVLATDRYLPDYARVDPLERDLPEHADLALLEQNLRDLLAGRPARVPVWSFIDHARVSTEIIEPAPHLVVEGIHALHARIAPLAHLRVLVEAPQDLRWQRWERLERSGERGWGVEHARWHFHEVAEPTFERFESEYRARADAIVRNCEDMRTTP